MRVLVFDHMNDCTPQNVQEMLSLVSPHRRQQALQYKHTFGQFCCLKSWLMLKELLGHTPAEWHYNAAGKPFLTAEDSAIYFSISHCREAIAVAVADQPIGVDVESIRHVDHALIERTMNNHELQQIQTAHQPARAFTALWTQKEAWLKWQGKGIESFEQLKGLWTEANETPSSVCTQTIEKDNYIYTITYGKLHCFGA